MLLKRSVRLEDELIKRVISSFRESHHFASNLDEHITRLKRYVFDTDDYRNAPRWVKSAVQGAERAMWQSLYSVQMGFVSREKTPDRFAPLACIHIGPDGRKFAEGDDSWLQESTEYKLALKCEHVWRDRWNQGEYKPW